MTDAAPAIAAAERLAAERLRSTLGEAVLDVIEQRGETTVVLARGSILDALRLLRDEPALSFTHLSDVTAVDYLDFPRPGTGSAADSRSPVAGRADGSPSPVGGSEPEGGLPPALGGRGGAVRFAVVYHLYSPEHNRRLRLRAEVPEPDPAIDSCVGLFPTANFFEREVYDMFGIIFRGHPKLERIMMPEEWEGHPLRKDHPVGGEDVEFTYNVGRVHGRQSEI